MNVVIYDPEDLEPITILNISRHWLDDFDTGKRLPRITFPIYDPILIGMIDKNWIPTNRACRSVDIRFERFRYREKVKWMAFAENSELCLLLKSVFLPGQTKELNEIKKVAAVKGFLNGLALAMKD